MKNIFQFQLLLCVATFLAFPPVFAKAKMTTVTFEEWLEKERVVAKVRMQANISPVDSVRGIIIASPQRQDPDYYFHWIRDSALVIEAVMKEAEATPEEQTWLQDFTDFVVLSEKLQTMPAMTGLGEPRFNIDGTAYSGDWARPQNDGPALRVLAVLRGKELLHERANKNIPVDPALFQKISKITETDVQYILSHWDQPCYDLWEEVRGQHFYTRQVQWAALQAAKAHFNPGWSFTQAQLDELSETLRQKLESHWQPEKGYFAVTLDRMDGAEKYKFTDLDVAVVLSTLHAKTASGPLSFDDDRLLATMTHLENAFEQLYGINHTADKASFAPAIGRYTDDVYFGGNPWYLTTAAFAEIHYKLAQHWKGQKTILVTERNLPFLQKAWGRAGSNLPPLKIGMNLGKTVRSSKALWQALRTRGDQFLARLQLHTPGEGGMAEQFERTDGRPMSARDLTWSYAAFLTALKAREAAAKY